MRVSWKRPDYLNGIISGYRVSVGYYESGRGQINITDTSNTTLSATIQHSSLGECPSEDSMHAPLIPVVWYVFSVLHLDPLLPEPGVPYNGSVVAINQVGEGQGWPQLFYTRELSKRLCPVCSLHW